VPEDPTSSVQWHRSSQCTNGACVEIAWLDKIVAIRNSAAPSTVIISTREDWARFVAGIKDGSFSVGH
jgi:predicted secreted Zn-dependent protease